MGGFQLTMEAVNIGSFNLPAPGCVCLFSLLESSISIQTENPVCSSAIKLFGPRVIVYSFPDYMHFCSSKCTV